MISLSLMNIFDIVIGILLALGFYKGFKNGLIVEVSSLLGLVVGVVGAFYITKFHGLFLGQWLDWEEPYLKITTFIVSFIVLVILTALLGKLLTKVVDYAALGFLNKCLGGVFGALKFALILSILLLVFNAINSETELVDKNTLDSSLFYPYLNAFTDFIWPKLIEMTEAN